jgi:hypothetical protein
MNFIVSPDALILTDESIALSVHCVQTIEDITLTLAAPSLDTGAIKIM